MAGALNHLPCLRAGDWVTDIWSENGSTSYDSVVRIVRVDDLAGKSGAPDEYEGACTLQ